MFLLLLLFYYFYFLLFCVQSYPFYVVLNAEGRGCMELELVLGIGPCHSAVAPVWRSWGEGFKGNCKKSACLLLHASFMGVVAVES